MPFWRASRSSARSEAWPRSGITVPERLERSAARSVGGHLPEQFGGVDPGSQHTASGGALRVRCDGEHWSMEAGVDPASRAGPPGAPRRSS